jgi:AcrR family transcriptional regulator
MNFMASTKLSQETRDRILETAWKHAWERGIDDMSVKEIAAAAGVSRQLIYYHYKNRAGLLLAMARRQDRRSEFAKRVDEAAALPPREGFEMLIRSWCEYVPELLPVARALEAALITGEDGAAAWRDRFGTLHEVIRGALARVDDAGLLASGWSLDAAADWAWARVQPGSWDYLVRIRGWEEAELVERLTRSVVDEVVPSPA